jgi:hypothetical protein
MAPPHRLAASRFARCARRPGIVAHQTK